ncbi:MAG: hypothetical protein AB8G96_00935 [Phycisphaerales bacterium]
MHPKTFATRCRPLQSAALATFLLITPAATATVIEYSPLDEAELAWEAAVGDWQTIDFTDLEEGDILTDQYREEFGVVFETAPFSSVVNEASGFLHDGFGFTITTINFPNLGGIITFETPMQAIAIDHPGTFFVKLTLADGTVFESFPGLGGLDRFSGWTSDVPIVQAEFGDFDGSFNVDDLRLVPVPGPASIAVLGVAAAMGPRRRRSRHGTGDP